MPGPRKAKPSDRRGPAMAPASAGRYVALLRGVNVGGSGALAMADLRTVLSELGYLDVSTILQSGNAVFAARDSSPARIEKAIEAKIAQRLGPSPDVLVRTAAEWQTVLDGNPFAREAEVDPSHLVVVFLKAGVTVAQVAALQADVHGPELIRGVGRELYITYPDGIGRSKLTGTLIERKLAVRATARNWNTLLRIAKSLAG